MTKQVKNNNKELEKIELIKLRRDYTRETNNYFLDDITKYADWLERKLVEINIKNVKKLSLP